MTIILKNHITLSLLIISSASLAGGFSNPATPTRIDIDRNNGLMIYGDFGNPSGCTINNRVYVKIGHPQYDQIYAMTLTAFSAAKKIQAYIHTCEPVLWYTQHTTTYNILNESSTLYMTN